jgi:uroporphyrinogen decarboxylase
MTSKERVHSALNHQPTDRVPVYMWFHPDTTKILAELFEVPLDKVDEVMCNDVRQTWVGNNYAMEGIVHDNIGETHTDDWGIEWVKEGAFNQIKFSPLEDATEEEIRAYKHPEHKVDELMSNMDPLIPFAKESFIGCDISPCLFEMVWRLRGMEETILNLIEEPELSEIMLDQALQFSIRLAEEAIARFPLDWLWTGDDVAGQQSMIMSPACWRELIKPKLAKIFAIGKEKKLWVAHHCCGSLHPIIPDLIEIGMDVLNPVQCNCPDMEPIDLKKEFGQHISFMGGVDTQYLLPNGTAEEIYSKTSKLVEGMTSDGGGYILAASHTVPPETPLENIFAMYRAAGITKEEIFDSAATCRAN